MKLETLLKKKKSTGIISIAPNAMLSEAMKLMKEKNVGALLVCEAEVLKGVISEMDVVNRGMLANKDLSKTAVWELMTAKPITCKLSDTLAHALAILCAYGFRHLPVVNDLGIPVSVLNERDVIGILLKNGNG